MNIILIEQDEIFYGRAELSGRRHDHIVSILKSKVGDALKVGVINGGLGEGMVAEITDHKTVLEINLLHQPKPKMPLIVILALPRPPVFRRVLAALTSFGVEHIVCMHTARVEKSYWNSPVLSEDNIRRAMVLGLEQSGDTVFPGISFEQKFKPFVENALPHMIQNRKCFIAHPDNAKACPSNIADSLVLAIGPEGGFVDYEVQKFCDLGFQSVHLGERILRVETAVSALIGRLMQIELER